MTSNKYIIKLYVYICIILIYQYIINLVINNSNLSVMILKKKPISIAFNHLLSIRILIIFLFNYSYKLVSKCL